jgi:hypothetical protein
MLDPAVYGLGRKFGSINYEAIVYDDRLFYNAYDIRNGFDPPARALELRVYDAATGVVETIDFEGNGGWLNTPQFTIYDDKLFFCARYSG